MRISRDNTQAVPSYAASVQAAVGNGTEEYLAFRLGDQLYAVDILTIQEIRSYEQPTRMAGSSSHLLGVLNLRGTIVPVVDLRARLGLSTGFDGHTVTMVMTLASGTIGVVVDAVSGVVELHTARIQPSPSFDDSAESRLIQGLTTSGQGEEEQTLIVMNLEGLLPRPSHASSAALQISSHI